MTMVNSVKVENKIKIEHRCYSVKLPVRVLTIKYFEYIYMVYTKHIIFCTVPFSFARFKYFVQNF